MQIVWTRSAKTDLRVIFDYYKYKASSSIAHKIKNACFDRVEILYKNPEAGPVDEILKILNENHCYLIEGNYKIIYKIVDNTIFITGVFDTRQNPQKIFSKKIIMHLYGLIGFPLTHSFSKKYFTEKFQKENIADSRYELFEIPEAKEVLDIVKNNPTLKGLNVTIPHKEKVIQYLHEIDPAAKEIGAVNVIKIKEGRLKGYNSDYYGFRQSLVNFIGEETTIKALILGTGGAAKAVKAALNDLNIPYTFVSRKKEGSNFSYEELNETILSEYKLIINTSPLGMYPKTESYPEIPYQFLTPKHFLFDLVYNPEETTFMKKGTEKGAKTANGLEMLHLQAEKAWEIWNAFE